MSKNNQMNATFASFQMQETGAALLGNIENMTNQQLRERLVVAETLMRKLYNRNKDIEVYHRQKMAQYEKQPNSQINEQADELELLQ